MADDIVTRIREEAKKQTTLGQAFDMLHVADEIERLRAALDAEGNDANLLMLEIERLRAALALAVGELSTVAGYKLHSPEALMNRFLDEADDD